ncbi:MAG: pyrroloquinoline quinone biosynthesis protein PqqD [Candidatus Rokuibacteriota bacterium]|nr:MAG: pyrroloquinoline quinone biosynthesis protein PqqD [Candidatus Rokubacteria bacterium]
MGHDGGGRPHPRRLFMQGDRVYRINRPRVIFENIEGELILVNMEKGCYFSTDQVGADIWGLIETGHSQSDILEALRFRYEGDAAEMAQVVAAFLKLLEREELVVPDSASQASGARRTAAENRRSPFRAPDLQKYTDMRDMLLLDPVHDVEAAGWPVPKVEESWPSADAES